MNTLILNLLNRLGKQCTESVFIRSFSGPYFPVFGLNMENYSVRIRENMD